MSYDGAVRFLSVAREAIQVKDYERKHIHIGKAQGLLTELLKGLDFEQGGDVAVSLDTLYRFLYDKLTLADLRDDASLLGEVASALRDLKQTWEQAMTEAGPAAPARAVREFALSV